MSAYIKRIYSLQHFTFPYCSYLSISINFPLERIEHIFAQPVYFNLLKKYEKSFLFQDSDLIFKYKTMKRKNLFKRYD